MSDDLSSGCVVAGELEWGRGKGDDELRGIAGSGPHVTGRWNACMRMRACLRASRGRGVGGTSIVLALFHGRVRF